MKIKTNLNIELEINDKEKLLYLFGHEVGFINEKPINLAIKCNDENEAKKLVDFLLKNGFRWDSKPIYDNTGYRKNTNDVYYTTWFDEIDVVDEEYILKDIYPGIIINYSDIKNLIE